MLGGMHGDDSHGGDQSYDFLKTYLYEQPVGLGRLRHRRRPSLRFSTSEITTEIDKVRA